MLRSKNFDVIVVGGGVAGVAAALEASRSGYSTALIEKTIIWGGMATSGLVPIYEPLCDGKGRQVTFGIAEELLKVSIKYGPETLPACWSGKGSKIKVESEEITEYSGMDRRYYTLFNPHSFALGLDEVLEKSGVALWLDTLACEVVLKGNRIVRVEVENKSGRIALAGKMFIDATGDADLAFRSGAGCSLRGSYPSLLYQYASLDNAVSAAKAKDAGYLIKGRSEGAREFGNGYNGKKGIFTGVTGRSVSEFVMESRKIAREGLLKEQKLRGKQNFYPVTLPSMHQIRMTRKIKGLESVEDKMKNKYCSSSVGMVSDCRTAGAVWEVPYGSLIPEKAKNLLVAGRCIDAGDYSWQVTRLIQSAALTGQVTGLAAGLAIKKKTSPGALDVKDVQKALLKKRIKIHI